MVNESYIETMQETIDGIEKFLKLASPYFDDVIDNSEREKLLKHQENMKNLQRKLKYGELEVAVVGLEKAGKSIFSSAFVGKTGLFPSADERCTFTSTKLQYADKDRATVEFYSEHEFCEKFEKMLTEVKFSNGKFKSIQLETFEKHFESLKNSDIDRGIYLTHSSKTEVDIKDIINGRDKISNLLGKGEDNFNDLKSPDLKHYITDKHISRAVKNVTFYSANLEGLENIILYDVPGFDSPTQVHLEQTVKKLQDVDAIIMVKKIKEPSLKGGEVDILVKNSDMDGIKLYEKLFIFGSYADTVTNLESLNKNKNTLIGDLSQSLKYEFDESRLFTGCLDKQFEENLKRIGSQNELEKLKQKLVDYNAKERKNILEKRINKATEEIKETFRAIIYRNQSIYNNSSDEKIDLTTKLLDGSRSKINIALSKLINDKKSEIEQKRIFSEKAISLVKECMPIIDDNTLEDQNNKIRSSDARSITDHRELNIQIRKEIAQKIKENFVGLVISISKNEMQQLEEEVLEIFLAAIEVGKNHEQYTELKEKLKKFILEITKDVSAKDSGFKPLVERFTIDLIDTMIAKPLGSEARRARFEKAKSDLYMLSLFSDDTLDIPYKSNLVAKVLAQKSLTQPNQSGEHKQYSQEIERAIIKKLDDINIGEQIKQTIKQIVSILSDRFIMKNISIASIVDKIEKLSNLPTTPIEAALFILNNLNATLINQPIDPEETYLDGILSDVKEANSQDGVKQEIEIDLTNLAELFKTTVISAMSLELPFVAAITLLISTIKAKTIRSDTEDGEEFRKFLSENITSIYCDNFRRIDDEKSKIEIKSKIVSEMSKIIHKLEIGE